MTTCPRGSPRSSGSRAAHGARASAARRRARPGAGTPTRRHLRDGIPVRDEQGCTGERGRLPVPLGSRVVTFSPAVSFVGSPGCSGARPPVTSSGTGSPRRPTPSTATYGPLQELLGHSKPGRRRGSTARCLTGRYRLRCSASCEASSGVHCSLTLGRYNRARPPPSGPPQTEAASPQTQTDPAGIWRGSVCLLPRLAKLGQRLWHLRGGYRRGSDSQQGRDLLSWHRSGEQVALDTVASAEA